MFSNFASVVICIEYDIWCFYRFTVKSMPSQNLKNNDLWSSLNLNSRPRRSIKTVIPRYGDPMLKIMRSRDRLIFNMGIPLLVKRHFYIETAPSYSYCTSFAKYAKIFLFGFSNSVFILMVWPISWPMFQQNGNMKTIATVL